MGIKNYKPTSPGRRGMSVSEFSEVTRSAPERSLVEGRVNKSGGLRPKPSQSSNVTTVGLVVLTELLIGLNYTVMKWALDHTTPLALAALRTSVGAPFLLAIAFLRGEKLPQNRQQWLAVWWISLSITTVSSGFLVLGISRLSPGLAAMLSATMPLFTAIIAVLVLVELPGHRGYFGLLIGLLGAVFLAIPALGSGNTILGIAFSLISSVSWAIGAPLSLFLSCVLFNRHCFILQV